MRCFVRPLFLVLLASPLAAQRPAGEVPLFEGLGSHHREVTTRVAEAQRYFDQGLAFLFGFNHDEARAAFSTAAALDPDCALASWGVAMTYGPHINNSRVSAANEQAAVQALADARRNLSAASPVERALIEALGTRFAWPQPADRRPLDEAFAAAMVSLADAYPGDADIGALAAEALMDLHPWDLWKHDGTPQPWTPDIVARLERVLAMADDHPLALHLYIHAVEASPEPGKADRAADTLRDLMPALGHMVHMPSHIDVRRGRWQEAIVANTKAMAADDAYRARVPKQDFYRIYEAHNHHMRAFAAMMVGQSDLALQSVRDMVAEMPEDWLRQYALGADGWVAMPFEVLMRFGRWDELLAEPEPAEYLPCSRALRHYARGVAFAARGELEQAWAEQAAFRAQRRHVDPDATFGNNSTHALLDIAGLVLEGEVLVRAGELDAGLEALQEAVALQDALVYSEPPDWILPVRHPLGAVLLREGRGQQAEAVFRADLAALPDNGWGLFGLAKALRLQDKDDEAAAIEQQLESVWAGADVPLTTPCLCQPGI